MPDFAKSRDAQVLSTGFIAGFTIVFGVIALGIVDALSRPLLGELAKLPGALAFGIALPFLILGRAELFSENFFDPIAAAHSRDGGIERKVIRLWVLTLALNLIGGGLLVMVLSVEGALPSGAHESLNRVAEEIKQRSFLATLMRAIIGGALVALLSFLVIACRDGSHWRTSPASCWLGPFEHAVVTSLHLSFGLAFGASLSLVDICRFPRSP